MPPGNVARLNDQITQAVAAFGVIAGINLEGVQGNLEIGDLLLRRRDAGLLAAAHDFGINDRRQRRQDDQDQKHFNQCERLPTDRTAGRSPKPEGRRSKEGRIPKPEIRARIRLNAYLLWQLLASDYCCIHIHFNKLSF